MTAIAKLPERFTETDVDDEVIIMRLDNGELLTLAGTAAHVWRLIDGRRDRAAVLSALAEEFPGSEQQIAAEVDEFLLRLKDNGLVA